MDKVSYKLVTSDEELKAVFEVRKQVFVGEQGISEELELDGHDSEALHIVVQNEERTIGTTRVLFPAPGQAKIERMAVLKPYRHRGIGSGIISFLYEELKSRQVEQMVLHAQYPAVAFYKSCGFEESGPPFWEAGIKHIKMERQLRGSS